MWRDRSLCYLRIKIIKVINNKPGVAALLGLDDGWWVYPGECGFRDQYAWRLCRGRLCSGVGCGIDGVMAVTGRQNGGFGEIHQETEFGKGGCAWLRSAGEFPAGIQRRIPSGWLRATDQLGYQIMKAFDAGWGGAVWKTLGVPVVNVSSRYGGVNYRDKRMVGFNNIELITDRPLKDNLREISEVKKRFPDHAVIASLMVETKEEWHQIVRDVENAGADGIELNFGCPHGMCERGMGSAVGQEPKVLQMIVEWVKEVAKVPVITKLTPNMDITRPARAARAAAER